MADHTGIEWADATWNPIVGCSIVSPGCTHCYAMSMAARIEAMQPSSHYAGTTQKAKAGAVWSGRLALAPDHILTQPLCWRRPRRIFVNSMGDLFHEDTPDAWIDQAFAVMALAPQHTYQVLTKRSDRMRDYIGLPGEARRARNAAIRTAMDEIRPDHGLPWALQPKNPGIWLGISAEDQRRYDERREPILELGGGFPLFVSAEPLLGPLDLRFSRDHCDLCGGTGILARWPKGTCHICGGKGRVLINGSPNAKGYAAFSWIIAGGESGPGARPMHPDWPRSLRDQCAAAGSAFFFKQWGEWLHEDQVRDGQHPGPRFFLADGRAADQAPPFGRTTGRLWHWWEPNHKASIRIGKRAAGRLLDGVEHNAMPEVRHG